MSASAAAAAVVATSSSSVVNDVLNTVLLKRYTAFSIVLAAYTLLLRCSWFAVSGVLGLRLHRYHHGDSAYGEGEGSYNVNNFFASFFCFVLLILVYTSRHFYNFDFYTTSSKLAATLNGIFSTLSGVLFVGPLSAYLLHWFFLSGATPTIADVQSLNISLLSGSCGLAIHLATHYGTINDPLRSAIDKKRGEADGGGTALFTYEFVRSTLISDAMKTAKRAAVSSAVCYMLLVTQYALYCGNHYKTLPYFFVLSLLSQLSVHNDDAGAALSFNAIVSDISSSVLRNETNLLCYNRSLSYLFFNILKVFTHSFVISFYLIAINSFALRAFQKVLFYSMDFSKAAAALVSRGGVAGLACSESLLVSAIQLGAPKSATTGQSTSQGRQPMWQQIREVQNATAIEICKSSSGASGIPLLGCPVLQFLAKKNSEKPPLIIWGQALALMDLHALSTSPTSQRRRQQIFNNAAAPNLLGDLFSALGTIIDATTIQLQLATVHSLNVLLRLKRQGSGGTRLSSGGVGDSKAALLAKADTLFASTDRGLQWAAETLIKNSKSLRGKSILCSLIDFILDTPILEAIFGHVLSALTGEGSINDHPLSDAAVAAAINSVSSLSNLLVKSVTEDTSGLSQHYVCSTIYSLLALETVLLDYSDNLRSYKLIDYTLLPGKSRRKGLTLMPVNLQMLAVAVDEGISAVLSVHKDVLKMYTFPAAYASLIQEKMGSTRVV